MTKGNTKGSGVDRAVMQRIVELTRLRAQLDTLATQNRSVMNQVVAYSEAIGAIFAVARPLLDRVNETWPILGESGPAPARFFRRLRKGRVRGCELEKDMQQALITFRRTIYGLLPKGQLTEGEQDAHSTGPGFPEGTEGITAKADPEAPAGDEADGGVHDAPDREATEGPGVDAGPETSGKGAPEGAPGTPSED